MAERVIMKKSLKTFLIQTASMFIKTTRVYLHAALILMVFILVLFALDRLWHSAKIILMHWVYDHPGVWDTVHTPILSAFVAVVAITAILIVLFDKKKSSS